MMSVYDRDPYSFIREHLVRDYAARPTMRFMDESFWNTPQRKAAIPALDVPQPAPEPAPEPESASVQMLRSLLKDRRAELERVEAARKSRQRQVEEAEKRAADLRKRVEQDDTHIAAAQASIDDILADIEKLGGRPE